MRRTPAELRLLADCAQLVLVVAGLVALAQPWWLLYGDTADQYQSGWAGLSDNPHNQGIVLVAALVIGSVTTLVRVRVLAIIAAMIFLLGALLAAVGANQVDSGGEVLGSTWLGLVLVVLAAGQQIAVAALARSRTDPREG